MGVPQARWMVSGKVPNNNYMDHIYRATPIIYAKPPGYPHISAGKKDKKILVFLLMVFMSLTINIIKYKLSLL